MTATVSLDAARRRSRSLLRLAAELTAGPFTRPNPAPAFVLGNQKSGTTAVAALLADLTGASVAQDLIREVVWPSYDRVRSGRLTIDALVRRNRLAFSRDIVKEPHLTPFHDQLRARFPASRAALVVRDPRDNIRSILDRLGVPGDRVEEAAEHRHRNDRGWRLVLDGSWLGIDAPTILEHLAERWNLCADVHLDHPDDVVLVRYEDVVEDPTAASTALAASLGLPLRRSEVSGRSTRRAHQPRGANRGRAAEDFFGEVNLRTIERVCGPRMARLGYEPVA